MTNLPNPTGRFNYDQGSLRDRYAIYEQCAADLKWTVKTFEEWCAS